MTWSSPITWVAGQITTAAQLNTGIRDNLLGLADGSWGRDLTLIRNTADQGVTNSTVLVNSGQLAFTAAANASYIVEVGLVVTVSGSASAPDVKVAWSLPAGAAWTGGAYGADIALVGSSGSAEFLALVGATTSPLAYGITTTNIIVHKSTILMSSTAGVCNLQFAQQVANAATTTVRAGSWLRAERCA